MNHQHKYYPAITFDYTGEATEYGICECGKTEL